MDIVDQLRRDAYAPHFTSVGAATLMERSADEIQRLRTTLNQALGIIVEFGNLNGFRNMTDAELGRAVVGMAERIADVLPPPKMEE